MSGGLRLGKIDIALQVAGESEKMLGSDRSEQYDTLGLVRGC